MILRFLLQLALLNYAVSATWAQEQQPPSMRGPEPSLFLAVPDKDPIEFGPPIIRFDTLGSTSRGSGQPARSAPPPSVAGFQSLAKKDRQYYEKVIPGILAAANAIQIREIRDKSEAYAQSRDQYAKLLDRCVSLGSAKKIADELEASTSRLVARAEEKLNAKLEALPHTAESLEHLAQQRQDRTGVFTILDRASTARRIVGGAEQLTQGAVKETLAALGKGLDHGTEFVNAAKDVTDGANAGAAISKIISIEKMDSNLTGLDFDPDPELHGLYYSLNRIRNLRSDIRTELETCKPREDAFYRDYLQLKADLQRWIGYVRQDSRPTP